MLGALTCALALLAGGCAMAAPETPEPSGADSYVRGRGDARADPDLDRLAELAATTKGLDVIAPVGDFVLTDPGPRPQDLPLAPEVRAGTRLGAGPRTVYALGDSVMLATQGTLPASMGGWTVVLDGRVSRRIPEGIGLLEANSDRLTQVVVILLGHNYGGGGSAWGSFKQMLDLTGDVERVVLVTVAEWSPAQREVNNAIRHAAQVYPNVVIADWAAVAAANPGYLASDRVHLSGSGMWALAQTIATVVGPLPDAGSGPYPPLPTVPPSAPPPTRDSTTTTEEDGGSTTSSSRPSSTTTTKPSSTTSTVRSSSSTSSSVSSTSSSTSTTTGASSTTIPAGADG